MSSIRNEPIAIIGMACRFPGGVNSPSKLWELLEKPSDVAQDIPPSRFNTDRFYHKVGSHHGTTNVRQAYLLSEDVREFDARFFSIPPGEAEAIDPQQRLLLEVTYEAIETSGHTLSDLSGSDAGVFVGLMSQDYFALNGQDVNSIPTFAASGTAASNASSRLSYFFNWHGPSMTIDTACSSSMVAVSEAVQTLRNGTSRVAIACGTNLCLSASTFITLSKLSMLSPTSRCRMWDIDADGYARGEGVACIVLKTLSAAIEDGDNIECVIREVGVNHDGRTKRLTMPSAAAQASLIQNTYARAGLDPTSVADRCQYFEAHGTGTKAGDPQEAEALMKAFFPNSDSEGELLVGSIKTVVGHTEGTAGLAGLLKACLALQNATVPPNLLFNRLNPDLEPFTKHLRIPTASQPWLELPEGVPRRASVNSFGFGGTNAHCILETYTPKLSDSSSTVGSSQLKTCCIPVVFSAASDSSLLRLLQSTLEFLDRHAVVDMSDLAYSLSTRRSPLNRRLALSAASVNDLRRIIGTLLEEKSENESLSPFISAAPGTASLLGVFTGQGAQWKGMGAQLISSIPMVRGILEELNVSLATLPSYHRPAWDLIELLTDSTTPVEEATFSQPLCTAVQIVLVDLLRAARVKLQAVVGHSSGEIAAAYAAGFLSARDAICVAYYRGFYAKLAAGPSGEKGAMLAAGTSFEDASELCQLDDFVGRLCVAAHNSPTSVTLSGDITAISAAQSVFEEEEKFARVLKVDTAYHSPHMVTCATSYLTALEECNIQVLLPKSDAPQWFSSVRDGKAVDSSEKLDGQYWIDNMIQPVLFSPAIQTCVTSVAGPINCALEIGPHPALQGPAKDSILAAVNRDIPYKGTLNRGKNCMMSFSDALGFIWAHYGSAAVQLGAFQQTCHPGTRSTMIRGLPTYPWTHDRCYSAESRLVKTFHSHPVPFHDLLGIQTADGATEEWRWRNLLNMNELRWLSGHSLQGQVVFPATAYICLAMEAAMQLAQGKPVQAIDLFDLEIRKAIAIHDSTGTELLVSMTKVSTLDTEPEEITADFAAYSTISKDSNNLALNCCGHVRVLLGGGSKFQFSPRQPPLGKLTAVDVDSFYKILREDFGFGYDGPFRALERVYRKSGFATGTIRCEGFDDSETHLLFHPGMLDSALQGLNAAHSAPGDGRLWSIVAPTFCRRVSIIPALCGKNMTENVEIDCTITDPRDVYVTGDVEVFSEDYKEKIIEVEGLTFSPFAGATIENDRCLFQESFLCVYNPDADIIFGDRQATPQESQKALDAERAAFYYLKTFHLSVDPETRESLPWYRQALLKNAERLFQIVKDGKHPFAPQSWVHDTREEVLRMMDGYPRTDADFNLTKAVGENLLLPSVLVGETSILQYMTKDNYLEQYYTDAIGFELLNSLIAGVIEQLCLKFPRMKFLEVGAGTGGATKAILERIAYAFSSYTYTDISSAFFGHAAKRFHQYINKMVFKTLDITKDPIQQDFSPQGFDVIIASNVLHVTMSLRAALQHVRQLLRPGGYLVMVEIIRNDVMRHGLVMGGLPGWWVGENDGRHWGPSITLEEWDSILRETGFCGIETNSPMRDPVGVPGSIIVARAQNDQVTRLTRPLSSKASREGPSLLVLGGRDPLVSPFRDQLCLTLRPHFADVVKLDHLGNLSQLPASFHVLSLTECDTGFFKDMEESVFENFKSVIGSAASVLWLLRGRRSDNHHAGTTLGLFRTLFYEVPGTLLQTLDIDQIKMSDCSCVAELMLQLRLQAELTRHGELDQILWEFEPELVLDGGQLYIPRVRPHDDQNNRYNSSKRTIIHDVDIETTPLVLDWVDNSYMLREHHVIVPQIDGLLTIRVSCSFLSAIKTPVGYAFISLGEDVETGNKTLCFTNCNGSIVKVAQSWTIPIDEVEVDGQFMSFVIADLTVQWVLQMLPPTGTLVAYEPDPVAASLLSHELSKLGRKILFITSSPDVSGRSWVYLHPRSTERAIQALLPADVTLFIDASGVESKYQGLGSKIAASLSPVCNKIRMSSLTASEASILPNEAPESITNLLHRVASFASSLSSVQATPEGAPLEILSLKRVVAPSMVPNFRSLVYWREDRYVPVSFEPVSQRQDLFQPNRTYWLAGLAGDTGRSLADFMIAHNARSIVLSSRAPEVDESWEQWHKSRGATVQYFSGDITDFESVKQMYHEINESMPQIAGVANGAMMSFDDFQAVLRPKIQGTINLDKLFSDPARPLDWFIGFSSIAATVGNPGQSAYTAGNCFIKALVNRRRKQGLAGSSIDITRLVGLGFIERESHGRLTKEHQERLTTRSGTIAMSENDLHQLFAEAILSGRPASGLNPEIITGLAPITVDQSRDAYWKTNTRLTLLIREIGHGTTQDGDKGNAIPVRQLLEAAKTMDDAFKVLSNAFKLKLQALKFLSDTDSLYDTTPLVDMGVDSLVAVEMRSWFLKELAVDVPVMKILGGASISDLVEVVVQKLPQELMSRLDSDSQQKSSNGNTPVNVCEGDTKEKLRLKLNSPGANGVNGVEGSKEVNEVNSMEIADENQEHQSSGHMAPVIISKSTVV
ncbi:putative polyketide synthase [Aspergillus clavatus NRRL 1]|uniref:Polyketide synthase, putative n=1 Tax=Aspergillus clavatus (strain ATCC 1007 / CBS 513.65 / DSM 816 / NCTC 3887 / NRRL 1 / QM 1276 / 107) TaxID=344612 RepID=A1CN13_ASPCL|nr:polyketide synthase, putative [Aspergillus clavatus NRRL 1]EAW08950.1 polyketide synthase, putative [Aspergillus clavatus NRRL 1]